MYIITRWTCVSVYWYATLLAQWDKGLPSQRESDTGTFGDSALHCDFCGSKLFAVGITPVSFSEYLCLLAILSRLWVHVQSETRISNMKLQLALECLWFLTTNRACPPWWQEVQPSILRCICSSTLYTMRSSAMGWLPIVGSLQSQVSFAKEPYKRDYIVQQRPLIWRSLLLVATPYPHTILHSCSKLPWVAVSGDLTGGAPSTSVTVYTKHGHVMSNQHTVNPLQTLGA